MILLVVQLVLIGGLLYAASRSFDFLPFLHPPAEHVVPPVPPSTAHRFDGPAAMRLTRSQLAVGPRPAGSAPLRRLANELRRMLPDGRFEPVAGQPGLRNIIGSIPGRSPALLIGAHYDTARIPGFVGANNGASGTAAVIELARTLERASLPAGHREIRFVLFDGEEEPAGVRPGSLSGAAFFAQALRGSRAYVAAHPHEIQEAVVLDAIAGRGLRLPREKSSTPALWERVRRAAQDVGVGVVFPDTAQTLILDDHTPFLRAGVPAADLIDWSYAAERTPQDTYDKLSERSMDAVGETIALLALRDSAG